MKLTPQEARALVGAAAIGVALAGRLDEVRPLLEQLPADALEEVLAGLSFMAGNRDVPMHQVQWLLNELVAGRELARAARRVRRRLLGPDPGPARRAEGGVP